jgi:hypothetical protein
VASSTTRDGLAAAVVGLAVLVCGRDELRAQSAPSQFLRVRAYDPDVQRAVTSGSVQSRTFHTLVEAIDQSRAFVYIVQVPYLPGKMEGCVAIDASGTGEDRYLRMLVKSGLPPNRMIAVIGHEFQHVVEILGEATAGKPDLAFDIPGVSQVTTRQYETQSALDAEVRITAELRSHHNFIRADPSRRTMAR